MVTLLPLLCVRLHIRTLRASTPGIPSIPQTFLASPAHHPLLENPQSYIPRTGTSRKKTAFIIQGIVLHYKHNTGVAGRTIQAYRLHFNKTALLAYRWTTFHSSHTLYTIIISPEEGFDWLVFHRTYYWVWFIIRQSGSREDVMRKNAHVICEQKGRRRRLRRQLSFLEG